VGARRGIGHDGGVVTMRAQTYAVVGLTLCAWIAGAGCSTSGRAANVDSGSKAAPEAKATEPEEAALVPKGRTPAAELQPAGLAHTRVLRIEQDFHPNDEYEIALDAWVADAEPDELLEVRMWWMDTGKSDERSVFGKGVRRHIDITYERQSEQAWDVSIVQGGKRFTFSVRLGEDGTPRAYADVQVSEGSVVEDVLVAESTLVANKVLGLPIGLERMDIEGVDEAKSPIAGQLRAISTD
jgi:hypothetical protein